MTTAEFGYPQQFFQQAAMRSRISPKIGATTRTRELRDRCPNIWCVSARPAKSERDGNGQVQFVLHCFNFVLCVLHGCHASSRSPHAKNLTLQSTRRRGLNSCTRATPLVGAPDAHVSPRHTGAIEIEAPTQPKNRTTDSPARHEVVGQVSGQLSPQAASFGLHVTTVCRDKFS